MIQSIQLLQYQTRLGIIAIVVTAVLTNIVAVVVVSVSTDPAFANYDDNCSELSIQISFD